MTDSVTIKIDTDYHGDAMDLALAFGGVFNMRRHGRTISIAITPGPVGNLRISEAEDIARNLLAAVELAKREPPSDPPTFRQEPVPGRPGVVRPVLNKPIWIDPQTGSVEWPDTP